MVFGTWATRRRPAAASASRDAENAVSSPPIVTSASMPSLSSAARQSCSRHSGSAASSSRIVGLARDVRIIEPPCAWMRDTSVIASVRMSSSALDEMLEPVEDPDDVPPEFTASIVAAEITEFIPGAGPPPHRIPSFTPLSFQPRRSRQADRPCARNQAVIAFPATSAGLGERPACFPAFSTAPLRRSCWSCERLARWQTRHRGHPD